jgi:hypothetical protein
LVLNSFVVVNLHSPSERFVGRLITMSVPGVTLRGLDLGGFEDWMNDISSDEQSGMAPSTIFFPLHRIEKILLDEDFGESPSLASMFMLRIGTSIDEYL